MAMEAKQPKKEGVVNLLKRLEVGLVPDEEIRKLMKIELEKRLKWGYKPTHEQQQAQLLNFIHSLRCMNIAAETDALDSQMYEIPSSFLQIKLGSTIKESSSYFKDELTKLDEGEIEMLDLYCKRAHIKDGQSILDLGCGMGSLTLHVAQKYRSCNVTGITNSVAQKEFIEKRCKKLNLSNVKIILADVTTLEMDATFDRIFVISLIEHMKNYELFLRKISKLMTQDGLLFVEHYCHKTFAYQYEGVLMIGVHPNCDEIVDKLINFTLFRSLDPLDEDDWYTEYIFPAGTLTIPSASFLLYFQDDISVTDHWTLSGKHFSQSHEEWLKRIDANIDALKEILESFYGSKKVATQLINYWRVFCITGAEMYAYNNGEEWMISHYLFKKK